MIQPPRRNLPPDAEPWGRWVEGLLLTQNQAGEANGQSINNTLRGVNASLQQLGNQIQTLSAQQADITALLSNQVEFGVASLANNGITVTTTETTYASVSLAVPSGYVNALVVGISLGETGYWSVPAYLNVRPIINGATAPYIGHTYMGTQNQGSGVTVAWSQSLSGVSGSISVGTRAWTGNAGSGGTQNVFTTALAIFTK